MHVDLSTNGFRNLVQIQLYLKQELGRDISTEEVLELLLQNAANHVKEKTDKGATEGTGSNEDSAT